MLGFLKGFIFLFVEDMSILASTNGKYQLPDKKNRSGYIQKNFDEIAKNYDLFNDLITFGLHRQWKNQVINECMLDENQNARVLDLCCGSGDLTIRLAQKKLQNLKIHAMDFSSEMLKILDHRIHELPVEYQKKIQIHQGDVTNLKSFKKNTMNAVTIGFGLRNVQNRSKCLLEIHRVLEKKGRLVILDVGKVKNTIINFFHQIFFERIVPIIGYLLHRKKHEMYAYLPASAKEYPDQISLVHELEAAGFKNIVFKNKLFGASVIHIAQKS